MSPNKFRLNSNKRVLLQNYEHILPKKSKEDYTIRSTSYTPEMDEKINNLRAKYKISRSAIIRILLEQIEV